MKRTIRTVANRAFITNEADTRAANLSMMRVEIQSQPDPSLALRELAFLQRLAQAAATTQEPDELVDLIIRETTSAMGTDVCSLYLLQADGREMVLAATNGLNESMVGRVTMRVGEGITGEAIEYLRPISCETAEQHTSYKHFAELGEEPPPSLVRIGGVPTAARARSLAEAMDRALAS